MVAGSSLHLIGLVAGTSTHQRRDRSSVLLALQRLKGDPDALQGVRRMMAAHQPTTDLSRVDHDALLAMVAAQVTCGAIRLGPGTAQRAGASDPPEVQTLQRLPQYAEDFRFEGQTLRLVRASEWRRSGGQQSHEVVDARVAGAILAKVGAQAATSAGERAALQDAAALLFEVSRYSNAGLLLLRRVPMQRVIAAASTPAVTPSQLARGNPKEQHWIEIILRDEDGVPVANAAFAITTPDSERHTGFTDADGSARIDNIVAGQCQVTFPGLDQTAWKAA